MTIRTASSREMLTLWGLHNGDILPPVARYFAAHIESGNAEFMTVEVAGELIAELYIFKKLDDTDFADGKNRAYLCAFRVRKDMRGRGIGSSLMRAALIRLREQGFTKATIGVDAREEHNIRLYTRFGFTRHIKDCFFDPCDPDENMQPSPCPRFLLLECDL